MLCILFFKLEDVFCNFKVYIITYVLYITLYLSEKPLKTLHIPK